MPDWLKEALGLVEPVTEVLPAAEQFFSHVAKEVTAGGNVFGKITQVAEEIGQFATEIETAIHANTPAADAAQDQGSQQQG